MRIAELRKQYHHDISRDVFRVTGGIPNISDKGNRSSIAIGLAIAEQIGGMGSGILSGQSRGNRFQEVTRDFLKRSFDELLHLRPGDWRFEISTEITEFEQYKHLASLARFMEQQPELQAALGTDYLITPDIVVAKSPISDDEINARTTVVRSGDSVGTHTSLRASNTSLSTLHASISCKWTIRSDRSQNSRTEALNLIRNRKGHTPIIVVVTAEPLPTRLASLALGTGDLDHIYHFALYELERALQAHDNPDQSDMLKTLIEGNRLRDISDLAFDLLI